MWTIASYFVAAIVSALLPWVNAELMLLAVAARRTSVDLSFVVLAVTAGQVSGKSALYWIARRTFAGAPNGRLGAAVDRWRAACETRQRSTETMMMLSAIAAGRGCPIESPIRRPSRRRCRTLRWCSTRLGRRGRRCSASGTGA